MKVCVTLVALLVALGLSYGASVTDESVNGVETSGESAAKKTTEFGTIEDRGNLLKFLFANYDKNNYPSNIVVKHGLSLHNVHPLPDEDYALQVDMFQKMSWNDPRLRWDPKKFGGLTTVRAESDRVWLPDLHAYNSVAHPINTVCSSPRVIIDHDGKVDWVPACKEKVLCKNLTLPWQPQAEQSCVLKYGSWSFDGHSLDLEAWDVKKPNPEIYDEWTGVTSAWDITSARMDKKIKTYECCTEPYVTLEYEIKFKRREMTPKCYI